MNRKYYSRFMYWVLGMFFILFTILAIYNYFLGAIVATALAILFLMSIITNISLLFTDVEIRRLKRK